MEFSILPNSASLVRRTRVEWGLSLRSFAALLGVKHQQVDYVENGNQRFGREVVGAGLVNSDPKIRGFWLDYWSACQREDMHLTLQSAITMSAVTIEAGR